MDDFRKGADYALDRIERRMYYIQENGNRKTIPARFIQ